MSNTYQKNGRRAEPDPLLGEIAVPEQVIVSMAEIAGAAKEGLLALAVGTGLQVMAAMFNEDVVRLCGPGGKHNRDRAGYRHGAGDGSVTLGGRRVRVQRPRVRAADESGELHLPSYDLFSSTEILTSLAVEKMLAGLSSRRYGHGLEPAGQVVEQAAVSTSKSAVSRRFVAATETALGELMSRRLDDLDLVAFMADGVHFGEHTCVVALGIDIDTELVLEHEPDQPDRDRRQDDHPGEPLVGRLQLPPAGARRRLDELAERGEEPLDDPYPVPPEVDEQGDRGGDVQPDDEGQVRRFGRGDVEVGGPAATHDGGEQDVVPEAGDRETAP